MAEASDPAEADKSCCAVGRRLRCPFRSNLPFALRVRTPTTRCVLLVLGLSPSRRSRFAHSSFLSHTRFPFLIPPSSPRWAGRVLPSLCHPRVRVALPFYCLSNGSRRNVRGGREREGGEIERGEGGGSALSLSLVDGMKWDGNGNGMG